MYIKMTDEWMTDADMMDVDMTDVDMTDIDMMDIEKTDITEAGIPKKDIELSPRMKAVADMVIPGSKACDIGCDHAFVSIYLVAKGIADRVIASDVRTGPCDIARDNISRWGMAKRIELRLGDGLATVKPGEADSIIIAGMGGILITDILEAGSDVVGAARQLVLQPQSEQEHVRRYIYDKGWTITDEKMLVDAGKYYVVMNVDLREPGYNENSGCGHKNEKQEIYFKYGYNLLNSHSVVLKEYLEKQRDSLRKLVAGLKRSDTENSRKRCLEVEHELDCIDQALNLL